MKRFLSFFMSAIMLIVMTGCDDNADSKPAESNSSIEEVDSKVNHKDVKGFKVDGTKLLDANENEFIMRGINHAHTWFKSDTPMALSGLAAAGCNAVRVVLSDGDQWDKDNLESVQSIIEQCKELKMIAVLEVHDGTGKDEPEYLENAVNYWIEMKDALIGQEEYVILNIANEWYGLWNDGEEYRKAYVSAIPKLREAGINNAIMVDAAGWGQYTDSIENHAKAIFDSDPNQNTMFSIHFYGTAGGTAEKIKHGFEQATSQNLCICAGEFGYDHTDGDVDEEYLMKYCQENSIGYLGWSWKGNGEEVDYLDIADDWLGTKLSNDWGEPLINGENGIKKTAKVCTVFE